MRFVMSVFVVLTALFSSATAKGENRFTILAYHDVRDEGAEPGVVTLRTETLVAHFSWLREQGYKVIIL